VNEDYLCYIDAVDKLSKARSRLTCDEYFPGNRSEEEVEKDLREVKVLEESKGRLEQAILGLDEKEKWRTVCYKEGLEAQPPFWFVEGKIRIYNQAGVSDDWVENTIEGISGGISQTGLNIDLEVVGIDPLVEEMISGVSTKRGVLASELGKLLYENLRKSQVRFASAVVVQCNDFRDRKIIEGSYGIGSFKGAYIIMWNGSKEAATHETGHLLGIPFNHDDCLPEMRKYSGNYDLSRCVMNWHAPSDRFCGHCLDRIDGFWQGLEANLNRR
jgi:hypothetical protein